MDQDKKKARIVKANHLLQAKVGMGPIDDKLVKKSQKLIEENHFDFAPLADEYIAVLERSIAAAKLGERPSRDILEDMITPVMQIKANAAMFDYALVGSLANVMLNFLETIRELDKDVLEIIGAHQKTLVMIVGNKMTGDGGAFGAELTRELKDACKRYFAKQASRGNVIEDKDAFFIDV